MKSRLNCLVLISALLFPALLFSQTLPVRIVAIIDGDTVKVQDKSGVKYVVSLSGVDAPEMQQAYGKKSKDALCKLICDKDVVLSYNKLNTQGHVLSTIYINGVDVNRKMLENGLAWQVTSGSGALSRHNYNNYAKAENSARMQSVGLWKEGIVIPPWRWRQINRPSIWD